MSENEESGTIVHPVGPISRDVAIEVLMRQHAGVVVQDAGGRITGYNPSALRVLQMTADELTGRTSLDPQWQAVDVELQPLSGEQHPAMVALRTRTPVQGAIMGVRVGSGAYRWLRVDAWPIDLPEGKVVAQFTDISEELAARRQMTDALHRLQEHALPRLDLDVAWVRADSRSQSTSGLLDVGGSFLDVFPIDDQRLGFFVGDATGQDLDTLTSMVIARHTLRAAGLHFNRPVQVLRWLDDLLRSTAGAACCSTVYGTLTPALDGGVDVVLANAGNPEPISLRASDSEVLRPRGALLGSGDSFDEPPSVELHLAPGDRLVLCTPGFLTSARPALDVDGLALQLAGRVDAVTWLDDVIEAAASGDGGAQDDMTALVLTATGLH